MTIYDIARSLATQDNRGTADPYIIVLQEQVEVLVHPDQSSDADKTQVYDSYWNESFESEQEWKEICFGNRMTEEEIDKRRQHLKFYGVKYEWVDRNWFFTEEGYNEHVRLNSHNYRGKIRSYLMHCFRNPEMKAVFDHLRSLIKTDPQ